MATHLDLEEQEQLDALKHFWKSYGNLITLLVVLVLGGFAAWNGFQFWQNQKSQQAALLFDEVEQAVTAGDVNKAERVFADLKERFSRTQYAQQAGLIVAQSAYGAAKLDNAKSHLQWVAEQSSDKSLSQLARLRLSALLIDAKNYDAALAVLQLVNQAEFSALAADRRGDVYRLKGSVAEAKNAYIDAYKTMDERSDYRKLIEVKLNALGVDAGALRDSVNGGGN